MHSDDILIERAREGDRAAFDELYNKYKARIFNYLCRFLEDREAAAEITQEVFINVYLNIKDYEMRGFFKAWIYRIATNLAKDSLRKKKDAVSIFKPIDGGAGEVTLADMLEDKSFSASSLLENKELKEQIVAVLDSLDPIHKEIIMLCIIEELSYEEAAEALHLNVKTVSSRLARARKQFMEKINALRDR